MAKLNNITEAIDYIINRNNKFDLSRFKKILNDLGNPQDNFKTIHITGTNGKGQSAKYLNDLLIASGFKVGLFTSPHLISHLDRIRLNNEWIDENFFINRLNYYYELSETKKLSMFELDFLIMCDYFNTNKIDFAIIEVGIGARYDYTSVINKPIISIITSIGLDHVKILGNSLREIAFDKSFIIKKNSIAIMHKMPSLNQIFLSRANEVGAKLKIIDSYIELADNEFKLDNKIYKVQRNVSYFKENAAIAISAYKELSTLFNFKEVMINEILQNSSWEGRFEVIKEDPYLILDGAHNPVAAKNLLINLKKINKEFTIIMAFTKGHDIDSFIDIFKEYEIFFFKINCFKALSLQELLKYNYKMYNNFDLLFKDLKAKNLVFTGSLYLISELKTYLRNK